MKRIIKNKKYIILTLILAVLLTLSINIKNIITSKYKEIPEVKLKEIKKDKSLAIMVSEDRNKYEEYNNDTWPGNEYVYKEAKCIGNNGEEVENAISFERETNTVILETEKTIFCTLYFDYKGTGEEDKPYRIQYIEDLVDLQVAVNNGETYENKYFELARDLDFEKNDSYQNYQTKEYGDINGNETDEELKTELTTEKGWKPIGDYLKPFSGILDGKEHKIVSLYINNNVTKNDRYVDSYSGLFGALNNATVKNLTLTGNITVNVKSIQVGGFVGNMSQNSLIDNCHNEVNIIDYSLEQSGLRGGLVGCAESVTIKNSSNKGSVKGSSPVGGIIGYIVSQSNYVVTIDNTSNEGMISGTKDVGGLVGSNGAKSTLLITNSHNDGNVICTGETENDIFIGGLVGSMLGTTNIEKSYNSGEIKNERTSYTKSLTLALGGIIGQINVNDNSINKITNSYNKGHLIGATKQGGIIGYQWGNATTIIDKCYNTNTVESTTITSGYQTTIAGIIGYNNTSNIYVINSYNLGNISSPDKSNGFAYEDNGASLTIINSYNAGNIQGNTSACGLLTANLNSANNNFSAYNTFNRGLLDSPLKHGIYVSIYADRFNGMKAENVYYENSVSAGNVEGIEGTPMSLNDMKLESFVTQLNTNKNAIDLSSIDSSLSEYTLCNWKLGSSGYPELVC